MYWVCFSPAYATPKILSKSGLSLKDIDVWEFHEAFAVSLEVITHICIFLKSLLEL